MACTIAVARRGLQRSLARSFQVFSVAMARSPRVRVLACALFTAFWRRDSFGLYRCRLNGVRTPPRAPATDLDAVANDHVGHRQSRSRMERLALVLSNAPLDCGEAINSHAPSLN